MPLPSEGELSIKDLQQEATIPDGNTNTFVEMAEVYAIDNFNVNSPQNIVLADDFYGEEVNLTATSITLNPTLLTFPSSGGNLTTNLSLNGFALMVGKPGWLTTEKTYFKTSDAGSIQFTAGENNFLGASARSKSIQFIGQGSNVYRTLIVSQSGNPVEISLTPSNSQTIPSTTTTFTQDVTVTNPLQVFGSVTGSGFTLSSATVTNLGSTSRYRFTLTQGVNTSGARQAELNFDISGSNFIQQRSITHTQAAFNASVSVSPTSFEFSINGQTKQFVVTANTDWEVFTSGGDSTAFETSITSATSGFSTTTKNGTGNGTTQTYNVWVKVGNNSAGGTNDRSTTLVVRQRPWSSGGAFGNSSLTQDGNPLPSFDYDDDGGVSGFAVSADGTITAPTTSVSGVTITSITYSPSNDMTGNAFNAFTSPATKTRTATVSLRVPNQPTVWSNYNQIVSGVESATQNALQEFIELTTNSTAAAAGGSMVFYVTTEDYFNTQWEAVISSKTPNTNWVYLAAGAYGTDSGTFYVGLDPNYSGGYRYFSIKAQKVGQTGLFDEIQDIRQSWTSPPVQKPTFTLTPSSKTWTYSQSGTSNSQTFTATYNGGGAPTQVSFYMSDSDFRFYQTDPNVNISYNGGPSAAFASNTSGISSYSIGIYPYASNAGNVSSRTGTLVVSMSNTGGTTSTPTADLIQSGQVTWSPSPSGTTITRDYTTGNFNVTLTTNLSWSATLTNGSNATFALSGGNTQTGTGNKTFLITHGTNNRTGDLTGTLVLTSTTSGTSESKTYNLVQNPQPPDLLVGINTSTNMSNSGFFSITPSTSGQSYSIYAKHDPSVSGTVTWQVTYENVSHVGLSTTSDTTGGSGGNLVAATVSGTATRRFANFASNSSNVLREATIRVSSTVSTDTTDIDSSYGTGSGTSCILKGTKVKLSDGTSINVEELGPNTKLFSRLVDGMPIKNENDVLDWTSENLILSDDLVDLVHMTVSKVNQIYDFNNGLLKTTPDHLHLVKKQNLYQVVKAENVAKGDYFIKEDGTEIQIIDKKLREGIYTVYKLDVEENDLFIANGLITHNAKKEPVIQQ